MALGTLGEKPHSLGGWLGARPRTRRPQTEAPAIDADLVSLSYVETTVQGEQGSCQHGDVIVIKLLSKAWDLWLEKPVRQGGVPPELEQLRKCAFLEASFRTRVAPPTA